MDESQGESNAIVLTTSLLQVAMLITGQDGAIAIEKQKARRDPG